MKLLVTILAIINGGFMLLDGFYVLLNGKYIGPAKPGPWAKLFSHLNIDVFRLGPLFILYGVLWLIWIYGLWTRQGWAFNFGILISLATLWYLPFGTLISVIILCVILLSRRRLGI